MEIVARFPRVSHDFEVEEDFFVVLKKPNTEEELYEKNISGSKIESCVVEKRGETISTGRKTYNKVLTDIRQTMNPEEIIQNTKYNFKLIRETNTRGYTWYDGINMSFQGKNALGTLKEIIAMVKLNKMNIDLTIKLSSGETVRFKIIQ